jgi:hypothetical protein
MPPICEIGTHSAGAPAVRLRRTLRLDLVPISRTSHRRMVSLPTLMPISPSPMARVSAELPSPARRSSSSRCGSSWAVAWLRGWRDLATAWAKVSDELGVSGACVGNDMAAIGSPYAWWLGRARGAPRARSKRKRLDVGVIPHYFLLVLMNRSVGFSCCFVDLRFGRLSEFSASVRFFGECFDSDELFEWLSAVVLRGFCRVSLGCCFGGGGC